MIPVAMTFAGSDPSGGAGIQADLKTFHQHRAYGTSIITLLTVQNTQAVETVQVLEPDMVIAQLDAVLRDLPPRVAKTGALGNAAIVAALADRSTKFSFPLIVDPVMISKHGSRLLDEDASEIIRTKLLPNAYLVTPNLAEAAELAQLEVTDEESMRQAAATIARLGAENVLITGGHLNENAVDILLSDGKFSRFSSLRVDTPNTHGTGCVLSAAITARLAGGEELEPAIMGAKAFVTQAIRTNPGLGGGFGPTNMHATVPDIRP